MKRETLWRIGPAQFLLGSAIMLAILLGGTNSRPGSRQQSVALALRLESPAYGLFATRFLLARVGASERASLLAPVDPAKRMGLTVGQCVHLEPRMRAADAGFDT
jgi:hypothetical protein